ncbi:hypothetical protein TVAG_116070 [Trichomonas vaginalis G3]|uniref:Uncharacterized protein n=1 Tax=Trichomonas vaginalis (strain ATCC PRA-98 / G3) TaxID=412133 RepID=A2EXP3_TRIV3|nr:hypothetical protein TVAGG3_0222560 [Trichomonas vaginalis G3]EAY02553.1 hypothetical protein TVAG_116070 [Trichomonas vaginalis G3]KAI5552056.1 hypothetical protein TVAGG3_0222560 [Trichomonas vaginalis G3]|eukprot:XP_001314792.1 hypothetical protein [Trichomonas vaginalis G3]
MSKPLTEVYYKLDVVGDNNDPKELAFHYFYEWLQKFDKDETLKSIETRIIKKYEDQIATKNSFSMRISFYNHDHANSLRRYMSYREFDGIAKAVAFWYGIHPAHEVILRNATKDDTRRSIFEKFDRYGDIGRVTPCKSNPHVFWISYISSKGAKNAIASKSDVTSANSKLNNS